MGKLVEEFNSYREKMNEVILSKNNLVMKRFWGNAMSCALIRMKCMRYLQWPIL